MARKKATDGNEADGPAGPTAPTALNGTEMRFIKAVFDNMTQKPDADWTSVAADLGLKDAKCAKERFRQMSVRHGWGEQNAASASPRKRGASDAPLDDAKVVKKRVPRKKAGKRVADEGTDDECEI